MRKPSKLGFCTCCKTRVYIFDAKGKPVRRRDIYREAMLDLNNGSKGRAAFCVKCLEAGVDAEEAMANLIAGLEADLKKKAWTDEFKEWYLAQYRPLKIMDVLGVIKCNRSGDMLPIEEHEQARVKPFSNLHTGPIEKIPVTKPPERFADGSPN